MNLNQNTDNKMSFMGKKNLLNDFANTIDTNNRFDKNAARVAEILSGESPKSNKDSRSMITKFLQDIDVEALSAVFILAGTIITSTVKIYRNMHKLNEDTHIVNFEPIDDINIDDDTIQNLFESEEFQNLDENLQEEIKEEINDKNLGDVLDNISYQFVFDFGGYMESLNANKIPKMELSLRLHVNNTNNFEDFYTSVKTFVERTCQHNLTDNDKTRLQIHYNKYK